LTTLDALHHDREQLTNSENKNNVVKQRIAHISVVVKDYDDAIKFYTEKLDFKLIEDTKLSDTKRWVLVAPSGATECSLLLARAADDHQTSRVGNQTGGRVFLFLFTDDFWRDYNKMQATGIHFVRPPKQEEYGIVAVFADLYGNLWDLVQPTDKNTSANSR
jgi:catechol 2,3-dioxygenase-like lactoylglutathione lyase family enzyme